MRDHPRLQHLTPHEQDVLAEFLSRLQERCGDRIAHVWLFGSKARGDSDEESDVDLLIAVSEAFERQGWHWPTLPLIFDLFITNGIISPAN